MSYYETTVLYRELMNY